MKSKKQRILASATVMSLVLTSTLTATTAKAAEVNRLKGDNRELTAVDVAKKVFQKAENVIIVNGYGYADAVSATPLAKALNAPILLTNQTGDSVDVQALKDLGAKNVYIVGGDFVVKDSLKTKLAENYKVERICGAKEDGRYGTNAEVAKRVIKETGAKKAILVSAEGYADALSVASIAAAQKMPVLFANKNEVPTVVKNVANGLTVQAVGGTGVLPDSVLKLVNAERITKNAKDRFETNLEVLEYFKEQLKDVKKVYMAAGGQNKYQFADALVASAAAAKDGAPVVLTGVGANAEQKKNANDYVVGKMDKDTVVNVVGGTGSVAVDDVKAVEDKVNEYEAEKAVKAYEDAKIETAEEITAAKALKAEADKAVEAVKDAAKKEAFQTRIAAKDKLVEEAEAKLGVKVESVSAINANYVSVKFAAAPKEDMLAQTVEVKNGAGVVVPVKALDVAAGDKTAEFEFVTAVKAADLKGVWTVDGVKYDLDLFNNLSAFLNAGDQLTLNKALTDLGIKNVDIASMPAYFTAKGAVTKTAEELTVADVQKLVDDVNAKAVSAEDEAAIVKAVTDAKTANNQVALLQALQNKAFVRVNPEWVATTTNGYMANIAGTEKTIVAIQTQIDDSNTELIKAELAKLQTTGNYTEVDRTKLAAAKSLVSDYAPVNDKGVIIHTDIKAAPKAIDIQLAVADVIDTTTPTALKTKLTALATLVDDTSKLDMKNYVDANGKAYLAELAKSATVKNTASALNTVLTTVNGNEATALVDAVKAEASAATVDADKLLVALNNLGLKQVASTNKDLYKAEVGFKTIADKDAAQVLVDTQNLAAVAVATKDTIIEKLNVFGLDNVVEANAEAYEAAKATIGGVTADVGGDNAKTVALVKAEVKKVNDAEAEAALVAKVNNATTAAEVKAALDNLAITSYVNVPSVDKMYIAEQVFALVEDAATVSNVLPFADKAAVTTALDTDTTGIIAEYKALIAEFAKTKLTNTATTVTQLGKLGYEAFDNLTAAEKALVAEKFVANYPAKDGAAINYSTLAAVKAGVDAAIAK